MNDQKKETAYLAGGCFWCLEAVYLRVRGVENVISGYAGGHKENPTYEQVSNGETGHAEVVKIDYNPAVVSYGDLLNIFFTIHDPTTINRQGGDTGTQYRSLILYANDEQKKTAEKIIAKMNAQKIYFDPIVTELERFEKFFPAEDYHQRYFEKNPQASYCQIIISPKIAKLREKYGHLYR